MSAEILSTQKLTVSPPPSPTRSRFSTRTAPPRRLPAVQPAPPRSTTSTPPAAPILFRTPRTGLTGSANTTPPQTARPVPRSPQRGMRCSRWARRSHSPRALTLSSALRTLAPAPKPTSPQVTLSSSGSSASPRVPPPKTSPGSSPTARRLPAKTQAVVTGRTSTPPGAFRPIPLRRGVDSSATLRAVMPVRAPGTSPATMMRLRPARRH